MFSFKYSSRFKVIKECSVVLMNILILKTSKMQELLQNIWVIDTYGIHY